METSTQKSLAIAELEPIITDVAAFAGTIEGIDVEDEETQGQIGDLVKMMMHRRRKLEDKRTSLVKPLSGVVADINALFKPPRDRIDEIVAIAKRKMNNFAKAQQLIADEIRRQEIETARREQREAEELANKLAAKVTTEEAAPVVEQLEMTTQKAVKKAEAPSRVATTRGNDSSVVVQKKWTAEIMDLQELALAVGEGRMPVEVLEPNMAALKKMARDRKETREYGGVRFFEDVSTVVR